ncbi:hypothetical protein B0H13DRAFT_2363828 [Mycena leptocephala]|nr:hypothetical protein B0H13DRAFT_2363828 [Mycena leptocephala]
MTKRKAVAGHDAASVPADDAPTLSKQENEAWAFFQDFDALKSSSSSASPASSRLAAIVLWTFWTASNLTFAPTCTLCRGPSAVDNYVFQVWSVYKAAVKLFPNLSFSGRYPDIDGSVQRPLFDAMSSLARLDSTFLIPKTTSVFSISFSDDESPENQPPKKKPKGPKRTASPAPSSTPRYHLVEQLLRGRRLGTPPKSSTKGPVIKAERVLPKPKPRNRKSAPEATAEAPRRSKKASPPPHEQRRDIWTLARPSLTALRLCVTLSRKLRIFAKRWNLSTLSCLSNTSDRATASGSSSRKRRRNGGHHAYDADQEYDVPDHPPQDVSSDVIDRAQSITETDDLQVKTTREFARLEKNLKREVYVCGHRLQHFLLLRTHLVEELNTLRADWAKNRDASPLEPDDIPEAEEQL